MLYKIIIEQDLLLDAIQTILEWIYMNPFSENWRSWASYQMHSVNSILFLKILNSI